MRTGCAHAVGRRGDDPGCIQAIAFDDALDHLAGQGERHEHRAMRNPVALMAKALDGQLGLGHGCVIAEMPASHARSPGQGRRQRQARPADIALRVDPASGKMDRAYSAASANPRNPPD
jgi:hypothetical protein